MYISPGMSICRRKRCNVRSPMLDIPGSQPRSRLPTPSNSQSAPEVGPVLTKILSRAEEEGVGQQEKETEDLVQELADILDGSPRHCSRRKRTVLEKKSVLNQLALLGGLNLPLPRLGDLNDVISHGIDPENVSGINLKGCTEPGLSSFLERILVLPLATKSLFWRKVQDSCNIWQGIADAEAIAEQLRDVRPPNPCSSTSPKRQHLQQGDSEKKTISDIFL